MPHGIFFLPHEKSKCKDWAPTVVIHKPQRVRTRISPLSLHFHVVQFRSAGEKHALSHVMKEPDGRGQERHRSCIRADILNSLITD